MTRRLLASLPLLALAACLGEPSSAPTDPAGGPTFLISDASHAGRPDFGWRPPIASTSLGGTFDPNRHPTVRICVLNATKDGCTGADIFTATDVPVVLSNYQVDWTVPVDPVTYYRIFVEAGSPAIILGFADVKTAATSKGLKPLESGFVGITDGSILPIKFRINTFCATHNCGGGFIDSNEGGTAYYTEDGETKGGITIPPDPEGDGKVYTVAITPCAASLPIPNPKFGSCLDVDVEDEENNAYTGLGVAFVCDAEAAATEAGLTEAEKDKVTLYKKHGTDPVEALEHVDDDCPAPPVISYSVGGLLRALAHGKWKQAGVQLTGLLAPKSLYARRLDAGAGGEVDNGYSLFQFAEPCVAGVGANDGTTAADAAFSSGDLPGCIVRQTEAEFNARGPAELRALFPALIITWDSDLSLNVDWTTRLLPYLNLGGGVLYEDPNNVADIADLVTVSHTSNGGDAGTWSVTAAVPGLTTGITGDFENNHIEFSEWDSDVLAPFLNFTPTGDESPVTVGLYGKIGTGCIVLTGPDQDFHGLRDGSFAFQVNQYNLLLNELRFVQGGGDCTVTPPPVLTLRATPTVKGTVVRQPKPQQAKTKTTTRPTPQKQ
jgi:hypothetical protein